MEHCFFAVLDKRGRCIAECYLNKNGIDCAGKQWEPCSSDNLRECQLGGRFKRENLLRDTDKSKEV